MNLRFLPFAVLLFAAIPVSAQSPTPFARPGLSIGALHFNFFDGWSNTSFRYAGDTVLCGTPVLRFESLPATLNAVFLRLEQGKVFLRYSNAPCVDGPLLYEVACCYRCSTPM